MDEFKVLAIEDALEGSARLLLQAKDRFGFVPNLLGVLAHAPSALNAYISLSESFSGSSLSPVEQQVVLLTVSFENDCRYCVAAHSAAAKMAGVPKEIVSSLRAGAPLPDSRLQALREFTRKVIQSRGWVARADLLSFAVAGYGEQQVLEVIVGVAMKTISNYTNHIAETPLDRVFRAHEWHKTAGQSAA